MPKSTERVWVLWDIFIGVSTPFIAHFMYFSIIVPIYNRPHEVGELLASLAKQTYTHFEVLVIEDGSAISCREVVEKYSLKLMIAYFFKENSGQGFSRNFGFERAKGDYFIMFDSDCIIPPDYLQIVHDRLKQQPLDLYGGPDKAHPSFNALQKAISYSLTSVFTTGGIRGKKKHIGPFHPRSFNMGIARKVYEKTGGYIITRMGEDIELSIRAISLGFKSGLIEEAFVYHKRRTSLVDFFKQLHFFGRARINISRFFPDELKLIHALPAFFVLGIGLLFLLVFINTQLAFLGFYLLLTYFLLIGIDSTLKNKSIKVGLLSIFATFTQLSAYGIGFISEFIKKKGNKEW